MSANTYLSEAEQLLERIRTTQTEPIRAAARAMANSIIAGRAVHVYGSGHSVIPVLDIFPRYGSYVGIHPIMDPRLMWFSVTGPGGARELLWLERTEGYVKNFLLSYRLDPRDSFLIYSHGGLNAAPIEMALAAKEIGATVVAVTSAENHKINRTSHSSGKSLPELADIVIDNCCPPEDAIVHVAGIQYPVAASSTLAVIAITMALLAEAAAEMAQRGKPPEWVFVSPNVANVSKEHNQQVFVEYQKLEHCLESHGSDKPN